MKNLLTDKTQENLEGLLGVQQQVSGRIQEEFEELGSEFQVLVLEGKTDHRITKQTITEYLIKKGFGIVYITLNDPVQKLAEMYKGKENTMMFVDAVTKQGGGKAIETENKKFVESPKELTELSVAIEQELQKIQNKKVLIVDSVSTLLIYNNLTSVEKFLHSLVTKARVQNANTVLFLSHSREQELLNYAQELVDKVIEI